MSDNSKRILITAAVVFIAIFAIVSVSRSPRVTVGSVIQGSEYYATSTNQNSTNFSVIRPGYGSLGSVVITTVGTAPFILYDATSTVTNTQWATTTLAYFGASTAAGTYTFDANFSKGLLIEYGITGTRASTTITWR